MSVTSFPKRTLASLLMTTTMTFSVTAQATDALIHAEHIMRKNIAPALVELAYSI